MTNKIGLGGILSGAMMAASICEANKGQLIGILRAWKLMVREQLPLPGDLQEEFIKNSLTFTLTHMERSYEPKFVAINEQLRTIIAEGA
jgi:hypothetical protein